MDDIKKRLLQVFANQSIRITEIVKKIFVSAKYFNTKSAISSDTLEKISKEYPQINMDWVVTGRGEMLNNLKSKTPNMNYLAKNLILIRERLKLSVKEFAEPIGLMPESIVKYEDSQDSNDVPYQLYLIKELKRIFDFQDQKIFTESDFTSGSIELKNVTIKKFLDAVNVAKNISEPNSINVKSQSDKITEGQ